MMKPSYNQEITPQYTVTIAKQDNFEEIELGEPEKCNCKKCCNNCIRNNDLCAKNCSNCCSSMINHFIDNDTMCCRKRCPCCMIHCIECYGEECFNRYCQEPMSCCCKCLRKAYCSMYSVLSWFGTLIALFFIIFISFVSNANENNTPAEIITTISTVTTTPFLRGTTIFI